MRRLFGWSLLILLGVSACANLSTPTSAAVILESTLTPEPTATEKFIPKQNDLIFVEFFAVT